MSYHYDNNPLPLAEPAFGYPGDPGPSIWKEFGLGNTHHYGDLSNLNAPYRPVPLQGTGQVDPDTAKDVWKVYAIAAMVGVSVLYLAFKKVDKRKRA